MKKESPIYRQFQAREVEKKFTPAIKAIANNVSSTGKVPANFTGYKVPAGTFTDNMGRTWQVQAYAVLTKKDFIKNNEVVPILSKGAMMVRFRMFLKYIVDWANN